MPAEGATPAKSPAFTPNKKNTLSALRGGAWLLLREYECSNRANWRRLDDCAAAIRRATPVCEGDEVGKVVRSKICHGGVVATKVRYFEAKSTINL